MKNQDAARTAVAPTLNENEAILRRLYADNMDLKTRYFELFGHRILLTFFDSVTDKKFIADSTIRPLLLAECLPSDSADALKYIQNSVLQAPETSEKKDFSGVAKELTRGGVVFFIDGASFAVVTNNRGFMTRSVEESNKEVGELGPRESFVEVTNTNIAMITRRMMTADIKFRDIEAGRIKTRVTLCFIRGAADEELVKQVEDRIRAASLPVVLESGYLQSALATGEHSVFPNVGSTTRPDVLCAKLLEGRVGILVEGTPEVLTVPYLFFEGIQSADDYSHRPFFASFVRFIRLAAIFIAVFLPAAYVALAMYNPEAFPPNLLYNIMDADASTPFSTATEGIIMLLLYEVMHEAGIRLPKPAGQGVSIVGSLVIGEAAVTSGIVGAPTVIFVAVSAICSYAVPAVYSQIAVLRFVFIAVASVSGIYGLMLVSAAVFVSMCSRVTWGVPFMSPIFPFDKKGARDSAVRAPWSLLGRRETKITRLRGSDGEE